MSDKVYCEDCKYLDKDNHSNLYYFKCRRGEKLILITREDIYYKGMVYCSKERSDGFLLSWVFRTCGERGRYYNPKS